MFSIRKRPELENSFVIHYSFKNSHSKSLIMNKRLIFFFLSSFFLIDSEAIKNCIQKEDDWNSDRSCHKEVEMGESDTKEGCIIQVSNKVLSKELSPEWACRATKNQEAVKLNSHQDDEYFSSYDRFSVHYNMIADKSRTNSYRDAIMLNSHLIKDKVVLDVGCGTGILSMFSVQAGASKVIGVDQSEIIFKAREIVRENKMEDKIQLVRGRIEKVALSEPMVDILVSEWMGYFLLFEGMLDSVIFARDKYLAPHGIILPNSCSLFMIAVGDSDKYLQEINIRNFWDNVYGFNMTAMKSEMLRTTSVENVPSEKILSEPSMVLHLNLKTCTSNETEFSTAFQLIISRQDTLTALAGFFDVTFDLDHPVRLSTSPHKSPTHWAQTVFYVPRPIAVEAGQVLDCGIQVRKNKKSPRSLDVVLTISGEKFEYSIK